MKNKKRTLPGLLGERIFLLILVFLVTLFFSNDFGLIDIQKTAIILAAGVDKGEDGKYEVTAQIAVPQPSDTGAQSSAVSVSGKGDTVAQAFREINAVTGWYPKLIFCDVILLGEDAAKEDVFDFLGYFLRDEYMSDNCLLALCEGTAKDILAAQTAVEQTPALALDKVLASESAAAGTTASVNLKDFAAGYYSESQSGYMPYLKRISASSPTAETGEQSGGKSAGEDVLQASRTALFFGGKCVDVLPEDESFALHLTGNKIRQATLEVATDDGVYALTMSGIGAKIALEAEGAPRLKISLSAVVRTIDHNEAASIGDTAASNVVKKEVLAAAEKKLKDDLTAVFERSKQKNADVFLCLNRLKKYHYGYFAAYENDLLSRLTAEFTVKLKDTY